jgi:hypothetical protein
MYIAHIANTQAQAAHYLPDVAFAVRVSFDDR